MKFVGSSLKRHFYYFLDRRMDKFLKKCNEICIFKKISYNLCIVILNYFTKQKMVDQNNVGAQTQWQVVMWGNPYDLVDNKNQEVVNNTIANSVNNASVPAIETDAPIIQNTVPFQQAAVQQNPIQNTIPVQQVAVQQNQVPVEKWPGGFMKWLVKFIAKMSGQPDPETGKSTVVAPVNPNTVTQQVWVNQPIQKSWNAFENIMGGVTWFLDKIEKKVEKVTWVDLDSMVKMPQTQVQTNLQAPAQENIQPVQNIEQTVVAPVVPVAAPTPTPTPTPAVIMENVVKEGVVYTPAVAIDNVIKEDFMPIPVMSVESLVKEEIPVSVQVSSEESTLVKNDQNLQNIVVSNVEVKTEDVEDKKTWIDLNSIS